MSRKNYSQTGQSESDNSQPSGSWLKEKAASFLGFVQKHPVLSVAILGTVIVTSIATAGVSTPLYMVLFAGGVATSAAMGFAHMMKKDGDKEGGVDIKFSNVFSQEESSTTQTKSGEVKVKNTFNRPRILPEEKEEEVRNVSLESIKERNIKPRTTPIPQDSLPVQVQSETKQL